jgi:hypothetical protein
VRNALSAPLRPLVVTNIYNDPVYRIIKKCLDQDQSYRGINKVSMQLFLSIIFNWVYPPRLCLNEFRERLALLCSPHKNYEQ